jgi:hypothetical protein
MIPFASKLEQSSACDSKTTVMQCLYHAVQDICLSSNKHLLFELIASSTSTGLFELAKQATEHAATKGQNEPEVMMGLVKPTRYWTCREITQSVTPHLQRAIKHPHI